MLQQAVDDTGPVEPGRDREASRDSGGLEPAGLLHPPDVQLEVRAPRGQWVKSALCAPGEVAAQVGRDVLAGGALETGQVGSHCQPQLISERRRTIRGEGCQVREVHHAQTLRLLSAAREAAKHAGCGGSGRSLSEERRCSNASDGPNPIRNREAPGLRRA